MKTRAIDIIIIYCNHIIQIVSLSTKNIFLWDGHTRFGPSSFESSPLDPFVH